MRSTILALVILLAGCSTATSDITTSTTTLRITTSTSTTSTTTARTTTSTSSTTISTLPEAYLVEPSVIGTWPFRTAEEALAAAQDSLEEDSVAVLTRFVEDHIGWTLEEVTTSFEGPTMMGYTVDSSGGPISVALRVVAFTPSREPVWAIDFASSLDPLDATWGPSTDIAENEEGWSALIGATPIAGLTSQPGVTGPYAQLHYAEWERDSTLIGPNGASIPIPITPDIPGVLSIWYFNADESVAGFSLYALPAGSFVAG